MSIFTESSIQARRERLHNSLNKSLSPLLASNEVLVIQSGNPIQKPGGLDQTYPFLPDPTYFWLTGLRRPGSAVAYNAQIGFVDFVNFPSDEEKIWEHIAVISAPKARAAHELENWLTQNKFSQIHRWSPQDHSVKSDRYEEICAVINRERRIKDSEEVALVKKAASIAKIGYDHMFKILRPGMSEKELQLEYEFQIFKNGAHTVPYDTIVGSEKNAAILHAVPTERKFGDQDLVLIDAGADLYDYCVDITRVFPVQKKWNTQQKAIYDLVQSAQTESIKMSRAGVMWRDVHLTSAKIIAEGLRQLNILKCSADEAVETGAISVFYPHGVGHMVGQRVRDVGHPENKKPKKYAGARLRIDIQIEAGHMLTVEPGCYFISTLINNPEIQKQYRDQIQWSEVEHWKNFGGVRIEDDILITKGEPENLTAGVFRF